MKDHKSKRTTSTVSSLFLNEAFKSIEAFAGLLKRRFDKQTKILQFVDELEVAVAMNDKALAEDTIERHEAYLLEDFVPFVNVEKIHRDVFSLEIRAGVGGSEAAIFANDLYKMYSKFLSLHKVKVIVQEKQESPMQGVRKVVLNIYSSSLMPAMYYEAGVHRIQRVPETECYGRIHTSTATVAVVPHPKIDKVQLLPKDLRVETFRASGSGGQHVNKIETAVRITHLPTNTVAQCQDGKSQSSNLETAKKSLIQKITNKITQEFLQYEIEARRDKIGLAMRNEKIRTYNMHQQRISDHRTGQNFFDVSKFMNGDYIYVIANRMFLIDILEKMYKILKSQNEQH